ncbi:MAG: nucleotidyl transferase AbiEii/AbiGii toxin family protein [Mycobacteriales bacterium]
MTLAEKVATMMSRRELNTRDRDFADAWVLSRVRTFTAVELRDAIASVAEHRNHEVVPLSVALENMPDRQTSYMAMLARMAYQQLPPASWVKLLAEVRAFIDPLLTPQAEALDSWDPATQSWTSLRE